MVNGITMPYQNTAPIHANHARCEVCDNLISYSDYLLTKDLDYSVCGAFDCKRIMAQKSQMKPQFFKSHLLFNKKIIKQRRQRDAARKKRIDDIQKKEQIENEAVLKFILNEQPELEEDNTHLLVLPSGGSGESSPANERINDYIDHLKSIIKEAGNYSNASEVVFDEHHAAHDKNLIVEKRLEKNPDIHRLSDKLCRMCKGGCCASGKEHAYLSVFSIRKYMDNNPELSSADVLDLYVSNISSKSINDSCINHTQNGCVLSRELRSDICNGYYCDSLKHYQSEAETRKSTLPVLVLQRSSTYWNRFDEGISNEIVNIALIADEGINDSSH